MELVVIFCAIGIALCVKLNSGQTPEKEFARLYGRWTSDCARRGLSAKQMIEESYFRYAWARLQRRMTEAVAVWPEGYATDLHRIATDEAKSLALVDPRLAMRFLSVVEDAPASSILYPAALKALVTRKVVVYSAPLTQDSLAAFKNR